MQESYIERILKARVYDVAIESPLDAGAAPVAAPRQPGPAQARGPAAGLLLQAARRLQQDRRTCPRPSRRRGVICASAGNHAQGVALAARRRGIAAVIVMPQTTPRSRSRRCATSAARSCCTATTSTTAYEHAVELARERGLTFVHPFDDPDVIAGQGTIGMEILRQHPGRSTRSSCRSAAAGSSPASPPT